MVGHGRFTAFWAAWLASLAGLAGMAGGSVRRWPRPSPAGLAVGLTMAAALLASAVLALAAPAARAERIGPPMQGSPQHLAARGITSASSAVAAVLGAQALGLTHRHAHKASAAGFMLVRQRGLAVGNALARRVRHGLRAHSAPQPGSRVATRQQVRPAGQSPRA